MSDGAENNRTACHALNTWWQGFGAPEAPRDSVAANAYHKGIGRGAFALFCRNWYKGNIMSKASLRFALILSLFAGLLVGADLARAETPKEELARTRAEIKALKAAKAEARAEVSLTKARAELARLKGAAAPAAPAAPAH